MLNPLPLLFASALLAVGCSAESGRILPTEMDSGDPDLAGSGGMIDPGTGGAGTGGVIDPGSGGAIDAGTGGAGTGGTPMDVAPEVAQDLPGEEAPPAPFVCTHVMGGSVLGQWWPYFEPRLDSAHWQDVSVANAYVESWADPANALWATATASACTTDSLTPDRVLLVTYSATLNSMAMYEASITKAVATIKAKFAGVKRIELLTTLRSPNNQMCPGAAALTVVQPYVDQAVQTVAAQSGGLVTVGPKIAVPDCAAWQGATTNLTPAASMAVGPLYFDYYKDHL